MLFCSYAAPSLGTRCALHLFVCPSAADEHERNRV